MRVSTVGAAWASAFVTRYKRLRVENMSLAIFVSPITLCDDRYCEERRCDNFSVFWMESSRPSGSLFHGSVHDSVRSYCVLKLAST
jgi:hypothetical protein